jgi:hypothetical protein
VARSREPASDFTRQRSLPFPTLVLFLMNLLKTAIQYELDTFYSQLLGHEVPQLEISGAAFTQARRRLKYEAFIELNDRGFPSFYLLALHAAQGVDYCMRVPLGRFKAVREFAASGADEQWVDIAPCATARKDCARNGLETSPLRVHLIRIELPGDEIEVLMTGLGRAIEGSEFAALPHLRWGGGGRSPQTAEVPGWVGELQRQDRALSRPGPPRQAADHELSGSVRIRCRGSGAAERRRSPARLPHQTHQNAF